MDFNLAAIDTTENAQKGVSVPLLRLDGSPLLNAKNEPVGLYLSGVDSEAYRAASRIATRARLERTRNRKDGDGPTDGDLDAAEADGINMLVAMTKGWFGILDSKHAEIKFTKEGARELYERFPVAKEQAEAAISDRKRFTKA